MTTIRKIVTSKVDGNSANSTNSSEIRPFGEIAVYLDTDTDPDTPVLMMFDGVKTHLKSKVLSPGILFGSNADSGDGNNRDTIKLIPDATLYYNDESYGNDQYLIVDPTVGEPGHIHLRAGGTQDQSTADLYLGGEQTFVRVSDTSENVVIRTSTISEGVIPRTWSFESNGDLALPQDGGIVFDRADTTIRVGMGFHIASGEGISLDAIDQTAILTLSGAGNGPVNQTYNKTNDTLYTGNDNSSVTVENLGGTWFVFIDGDAKYTSNDLIGWALSTGPGPVPVGVFSNGYKSWGFSSNGNLTLPNNAVIRTDGGNVEVGNVTNFNVEAAGVVNIYTDDGAYQWQFGDDSSITFPGGASVKDLLGETLEESVLILGAGSTIAENQRAARIGLNGAVSGVSIGAGTYDWEFTNGGSLILPGDIHGAPRLSPGPTPSQIGRVVNITPADDASDKTFEFRIDQLGETFSRAYLQLPDAEVDKQVAAVFPHTNNTAGYIFTQGTNATDDGMNDAFNIFYNNGDIKVTAMTSLGVLRTWKFGDDGSLTFPGGMTIETEYGGGPRLVVDGKNNGVDIRSDTTILIGYNDSSGNVYIGNPEGTGQVDIVSNKFRVMATVPTSSTGAPGDQQGQVAFDSSYIYYCTQNFGGTTYNVVHMLAQEFDADGVNNGYLVADTYQLPQVGWTVYYNGETRIIDQVNSSNPGFYVVFVSSPLTIPGQAQFAWGPTPSTNIWKRIAWSGGTW